MLAGVPLLRTRKHGRGYPNAGQPGSYLAAAAQLAVVLLICTNLAQIYILSSRVGSTCQESQPCGSNLHQPASGVGEQVQARTESLLGLEPALPAMVMAAEIAAMPFPDRHFAVFIVYSWNFDIFWTSLQTYLAAGWGKRLIIIDNSMDRRIVEDPDVVRLVGEVVPTRVKLTFSQAMNFASDIAVERNYTYFFWGHADVALLANNADESFAEEVLNCMDMVTEQDDRWGVTFFHYDWFSATRTSVAREIKYDTFITVYMSDCDYYPRVRTKWKTLDYEDVCPGTKVHVYDMKRALRLPLGDYNATKAILEGDDVDAWNRNGWKTQQWSVGEQVGWELWEMTTRQYFRYKWGVPGEGRMDCEVETENAEGEKVLRQYPFETVMDMLPEIDHAANAAEQARRLF